MSEICHNELFGVTDGKAVGTYVEHRFKELLSNKYSLAIGNSALGIDLPGYGIETVSDLLETEKRLGLPRRVDEKTYNKFVALTCRKSHGDDLFARRESF